jgi:D-aspartate ligase
MQTLPSQVFQPVLLGSDINAYGMARAFHQEYGISSLAFAHFQLSPTRFSRIIDVRIVDDFGSSKVFKRTLLDFAQSYHALHPSVPLLLIPCGDLYANLLSECASELAPHFRFNTLAPELAASLSLKHSFYTLCEQYALPYPKTIVITHDDIDHGKHLSPLPFPYPAVIKPSDSAAWLDIDFPGRKKAFIVNSSGELQEVLVKAHEAGYLHEMVIQEFIPGEDSSMRVLNAYVDQHHQVRMIFFGHPLLEDPSPSAVGNYMAILPDFNEELMTDIARFLETISYSGAVNIDMKYDPRDGRYKLFEINLRQGRSSFHVTLNGFNLARYFVDDLIADTPFNTGTALGHGSQFWLEIPKSILQNYAKPGADTTRALSMIAAGHYGDTLHYRKDMNPLRWLMLRHLFSVYKKRFSCYFTEKSAL